MIIFQITLTGPMLQYLAQLQHQETIDVDIVDMNSRRRDGRFVSTMQSLIRQGLVSHESPRSGTGLGWNKPAEYTDPGRRFSYQITPKGSAALQLAAHDLQEFLEDVRGALPASEPVESLEAST